MRDVHWIALVKSYLYFQKKTQNTTTTKKNNLAKTCTEIKRVSTKYCFICARIQRKLTATTKKKSKDC